MTEVTPILENTRFSSIFEYNRFMTPRLSAKGVNKNVLDRIELTVKDE